MKTYRQWIRTTPNGDILDAQLYAWVMHMADDIDRLVECVTQTEVKPDTIGNYQHWESRPDGGYTATRFAHISTCHSSGTGPKAAILIAEQRLKDFEADWIKTHPNETYFELARQDETPTPETEARLAAFEDAERAWLTDAPDLFSYDIKALTFSADNNKNPLYGTPSVQFKAEINDLHTMPIAPFCQTIPTHKLTMETLRNLKTSALDTLGQA